MEPPGSLSVFERFSPGMDPGPADRAADKDAAYWLACQGSSILVAKCDGTLVVPFAEDLSALGLNGVRSHLLGTVDGCPCRTVEVPAAAAAPAGWSFAALRSLFDGISVTFFSVAARALQVLEWDRTHRYCGTCGAETFFKAGERARECPSCGSLSYPRISPAVIVAVVRGDKLLLAHAERFASSFYSVLAGYVEPGETLEECVHREIREEVGIEVKNLRYFSSQPWPFPHSLMIAFTAEHASGEIAVDGVELTDAGWYTADALPRVPHRMSVARQLIDWFCEREAGAGRSAAAARGSEEASS